MFGNGKFFLAAHKLIVIHNAISLFPFDKFAPVHIQRIHRNILQTRYQKSDHYEKQTYRRRKGDHFQIVFFFRGLSFIVGMIHFSCLYQVFVLGCLLTNGFLMLYAFA